MKKEARRDFLKKSLIGISGFSLFPQVSKRSPEELPGQTIKQDLVYRTLGKTGLKLPVISMGTGNVSNPDFVNAALDTGIKLLQTASEYREGNNEKMLGEVFKERPRDSFMIATGSRPRGTDVTNGIFTDPEADKAYISDIEGGLERMGLDYVDILLLPFAAKRESVFFEPLLRMMENMKKQGKTRYIGIATHSFCDEAVRAAADTGIYDLVVTAYNFRTENVEQMNDAITYAANAGLGILVMKSQAGAFWDRERTQPINSRATLKWVLQNEHVASVVSGMSKIEELQQNIELMQDLKLTEEEIKDLKLTSNEHMPGLYCRQCTRCIPQCSDNLDIPSIMRSYMYAYGYRDLKYARHTLGFAKLPDKPCSSCNTCMVECSVGFNVKEKIQDIARLNHVPEDFLIS